MTDEKLISLDVGGYKGVAFEVLNRAVSDLPYPNDVRGNFKRSLQNKYFKKKIFLELGKLPRIVADYMGRLENNFRSQALTTLQVNTSDRWYTYSNERLEPQRIETAFDKQEAIEDLKRRAAYDSPNLNMRGRMGKLTIDEVLEIRERHNEGENISSIVDDYEVSYSTVRSAAVGETWTHLS